MRSAVLEVSAVSARYGAIAALNGIDLNVPDGAIVSLLGANGAGKTTLLEAIMGGEGMALGGSIRFDGRELIGRSTEDIVASGIALVPEGRQLFPELTVEENLRMGAYLRRDTAGIAQDLAMVRELFPRLAERRRQIAATLSGGEQQMVAIGRGLMSGPKLLLLDEPSLGLSPVLISDMMTHIRRINERGVTVLLVEQNASQALRISTVGYVIEKGHVVLSGNPASLADNEHVVSAYLGGGRQS